MRPARSHTPYVYDALSVFRRACSFLTRWSQAEADQEPFGGIPEETFLVVVRFLSRTDLVQVVQVSQTCWRLAIPLIWTDLERFDNNPHISTLLVLSSPSISMNDPGDVRDLLVI